MIAHEIAAAKLAKTKRLLKLMIVLVLLISLAVGFMLWTSSLNRGDRLTESQLVSESVGQMPLAILEAEQQNSAEAREAYLIAYRFYQNTVKPQLSNIDLEKWNSVLAAQILAAENAATQKFGEGNYGAAKATLDQLIQLAETAIADSRQAFDAALETAKSAFNDNNYQRAKIAITEALMLDTTSQTAVELAARIKQLPEIASLVAQIKVAEVERNARQELSLIQQLLLLTPERDSLTQRAQWLERNIKDQQFNRLIAQGYASLSAGQIESVKSAISQARSLYPNRAEIEDVSTALQDYEQQQRLNFLQQNAVAAERADDWPTARNNWQQFIAEQPNDAQATNRLTIAENIVSLSTTVSDFLSTPYRLSNSVVRDNAQNTIASSTAYFDKSPLLRRNVQALQSMLTAVNTPVDVEVRSDNQTHIIVRGEGNVGVTHSKVIQLTPGRYTLEGRRAGFKSKIKEVLIPYDQNRFSVSLVCDEPI